MRFTKVLTAVAAISMAATPVLAAAPAPASKLSLAKASSVPGSVRAGAKAGKSKAAGGFVVLALAIAAVVGGALAVSDGNDSPDSP